MTFDRSVSKLARAFLDTRERPDAQAIAAFVVRHCGLSRQTSGNRTQVVKSLRGHGLHVSVYQYTKITRIVVAIKPWGHQYVFEFDFPKAIGET